MKSDETLHDSNFRFIAAHDATNREERRRARSHAVKQALQRKRQIQHEASQNFRIVSATPIAARSAKKKPQSTKGPSLEYVPSPGVLDPFQVLAIDCRKFQSLLKNGKTT